MDATNNPTNVGGSYSLVIRGHSCGTGLQDVQDRIASVKHHPTFAVMLTFPRSLGLPFAACQIEGHPAISFIACDSSKPVCFLITDGVMV